MPAQPRLTEREWRAIAAVLPPRSRIGRPRLDDRQAVTELLFFELEVQTSWSGVSMLGLFGRKQAGFLSVRRQRWLEDGTWQRVLGAGRPAMLRWRRQKDRAIGPDAARAMAVLRPMG